MLYFMYLLLIVSFTGIFLSLYKLIFRKHLETKERLSEIAELPTTGEGTGDNTLKTPIQKALELPIHKRVVLPVYSRLTNSLERRLPNKLLIALEKEVIAAGLSHTITFREFMVIYFLIICLSLALSTALYVLFQLSMWLVAAILLFGILAPRLWLTRKVTKRKDTIQRDLPEFLDLLTVSVEAGLGFESSLKKVADEGEGPLAVEINKVISEISMGKSRKEALTDLKNRVDISDLTAFINAVIQAEQLGVGISKVLKVEAKEFRRKRRQRAEEQAMKAPIKMLLPLVFFIFPAIFVILLGPAVLRILDTLMTM
ncbi:type II secretion system F family protein [Natranaerofaba carboxydovora]|uniref:type II secretion system F family protein n=1 Tax=Natranaerofaba carboxydovora TaxID=2742683 RepID=UPI001F12F6F7|nr:type II secretion system F family protein [Natranaerofaba carboxydovora]UMZ75030.1 Type II secretion system (T2SS), protein F [Natranaerofaba carboxydovora]